MNRVSTKVALCCALGLSVCVEEVKAANPSALAYTSTKNVSLYARSTGLVISGPCNSTNTAFSAIRARGGEHLVYINASERPDRLRCAADRTFYLGKFSSTPLWPYPSYGQRYSWPGTRLTDMRPGSRWILHVVAHIEKLMRARKVDGVMLDLTGARLWSTGARWTSWSIAERNAWTDGAVDLVRRLDAKRRAINPNFIIINNGTWDRGDSRGLVGERYVDGVVAEHVPLTTWRKRYVGRRFGPGFHRRVIVIANSRSDAIAWAKVPGVTHVNYQGKYGTAGTPVVSFKPINDR